MTRNCPTNATASFKRVVSFSHAITRLRDAIRDSNNLNRIDSTLREHYSLQMTLTKKRCQQATSSHIISASIPLTAGWLHTVCERAIDKRLAILWHLRYPNLSFPQQSQPQSYKHLKVLVQDLISGTSIMNNKRLLSNSNSNNCQPTFEVKSPTNSKIDRTRKCLNKKKIELYRCANNICTSVWIREQR